MHSAYALLFTGILLEPDAALLPAAFLVHQGKMRLVPVLIIAVVGGLMQHWVIFALSRRWGQEWFERKTAKHRSWGKVERSFERHHRPWLLACRFIWGLRFPILAMAALSHVSVAEFLLLDTINCVVWALVVTWIGYTLGTGLSSLTGHLHHPHDRRIALGVALVVLLAAVLWRFLHERHPPESAPEKLPQPGP